VAGQRLEEIVRNLDDRIEEAHVNGWLGEVQGGRVGPRPLVTELVSVGALT
jgi:hypothetical protein